MFGENFQGFLIKFTKTNTIFPNDYIQYETYKITPDQRTEKKAWRDNKNDLHRITAPNHKTKLVFNTTSLSLSEAREIMEMFHSAYNNVNQRQASVRVWNPETCSYKTFKAYIPDITFTIEKISDNSIEYAPAEITMIQY